MPNLSKTTISFHPSIVERTQIVLCNIIMYIDTVIYKYSNPFLDPESIVIMKLFVISY